MKIEDLTSEQLEQAKKLETAEEAMAFIGENGIELSDEDLEKVSGGGNAFACFFGFHPGGTPTGNTKDTVLPGTFTRVTMREYVCNDCGGTYWIQ